MKTVHVLYRNNLGYNEEVKPIVATYYSDKDKKKDHPNFSNCLPKNLKKKYMYIMSQ